MYFLLLPFQQILTCPARRKTHTAALPAAPTYTCTLLRHRYVGYFWRLLTESNMPGGSLPAPKPLQLRTLRLSGLPAGAASGCSLLVECRPSGAPLRPGYTLLAPTPSEAAAGSAGSTTGGMTGAPPGGQ
jgi:hypothetical protein